MSEESPQAELLLPLTTDVAVVQHHLSQPAQLETFLCILVKQDISV